LCCWVGCVYDHVGDSVDDDDVSGVGGVAVYVVVIVGACYYVGIAMGDEVVIVVVYGVGIVIAGYGVGVGAVVSCGGASADDNGMLWLLTTVML